MEDNQTIQLPPPPHPLPPGRVWLSVEGCSPQQMLEQWNALTQAQAHSPCLPSPPPSDEV